MAGSNISDAGKKVKESIDKLAEATVSKDEKNITFCLNNLKGLVEKLDGNEVINDQGDSVLEYLLKKDLLLTDVINILPVKVLNDDRNLTYEFPISEASGVGKQVKKYIDELVQAKLSNNQNKISSCIKSIGDVCSKLENNEVVDEFGSTILHYLCEKDVLSDVVDRLPDDIKYDYHTKNKDGYNSMEVACSNGSINAIACLQELFPYKTFEIRQSVVFSGKDARSLDFSKLNFHDDFFVDKDTRLPKECRVYNYTLYKNNNVLAFIRKKEKLLKLKKEQEEAVEKKLALEENIVAEDAVSQEGKEVKKRIDALVKAKLSKNKDEISSCIKSLGTMCSELENIVIDEFESTILHYLCEKDVLSDVIDKLPDLIRLDYGTEDKNGYNSMEVACSHGSVNAIACIQKLFPSDTIFRINLPADFSGKNTQSLNFTQLEFHNDFFVDQDTTLPKGYTVKDKRLHKDGKRLSFDQNTKTTASRSAEGKKIKKCINEIADAIFHGEEINSHKKLLTELLNNLETNAVITKHGDTVLHYLCKKDILPEVANILPDKIKNDINAKNNEQLTPIEVACDEVSINSIVSLQELHPEKTFKIGCMALFESKDLSKLDFSRLEFSNSVYADDKTKFPTGYSVVGNKLHKEGQKQFLEKENKVIEKEKKVSAAGEDVMRSIYKLSNAKLFELEDEIQSCLNALEEDFKWLRGNEIVDYDYDSTILHILCEKGLLSDVADILPEKIYKGCDDKDILGRTPIEVACSIGNIEFIKILQKKFPKKTFNINCKSYFYEKDLSELDFDRLEFSDSVYVDNDTKFPEGISVENGKIKKGKKIKSKMPKKTVFKEQKERQQKKKEISAEGIEVRSLIYGLCVSILKDSESGIQTSLHSLKDAFQKLDGNEVISNTSGNTVLHFLSGMRILENVYEILPDKIMEDYYAKNYAGVTPISYACELGSVSSVERLQKKFNDVTFEVNSEANFRGVNLQNLDFKRLKFSKNIVVDEKTIFPEGVKVENGKIKIDKKIEPKVKEETHVLEKEVEQERKPQQPLNIVADVKKKDAKEIETQILSKEEKVAEKVVEQKKNQTLKKEKKPEEVLKEVKYFIDQLYWSNFRYSVHAHSKEFCKESLDSLFKLLKGDEIIDEDLGDTILHYICRNDLLSDVVDILPKKILDTYNVKNSAGFTSMDLACEYGWVETIGSLQKALDGVTFKVIADDIGFEDEDLRNIQFDRIEFSGKVIVTKDTKFPEGVSVEGGKIKKDKKIFPQVQESRLDKEKKEKVVVQQPSQPLKKEKTLKVKELKQQPTDKQKDIKKDVRSLINKLSKAKKRNNSEEVTTCVGKLENLFKKLNRNEVLSSNNTIMHYLCSYDVLSDVAKILPKEIYEGYNQKNSEGFTPIDLACKGGRVNAIESLLDLCPDVKFQINSNASFEGKNLKRLDFKRLEFSGNVYVDDKTVFPEGVSVEGGKIHIKRKIQTKIQEKINALEGKGVGGDSTKPVPLKEKKTEDVNQVQDVLKDKGVGGDSTKPVPLKEKKTEDINQVQDVLKDKGVGGDSTKPVPLKEKKTEDVNQVQDVLKDKGVGGDSTKPVPLKEKKIEDVNQVQDVLKEGEASETMTEDVDKKSKDQSIKDLRDILSTIPKYLDEPGEQVQEQEQPIDTVMYGVPDYDEIDKYVQEHNKSLVKQEELDQKEVGGVIKMAMWGASPFVVAGSFIADVFSGCFNGFKFTFKNTKHIVGEYKTGAISKLPEKKEATLENNKNIENEITSSSGKKSSDKQEPKKGSIGSEIKEKARKHSIGGVKVEEVNKVEKKRDAEITRGKAAKGKPSTHRDI